MCMFCRSLFVSFLLALVLSDRLLLALVLSDRLRFTDSAYRFGIFNLFLVKNLSTLLLEARHDSTIIK